MLTLATLGLARGQERNALLNAYEAATDSMRAIYPEHCWNGMLDDGSDTGYNYGTAAIPKYLNQVRQVPSAMWSGAECNGRSDARL